MKLKFAIFLVLERKGVPESTAGVSLSYLNSLIHRIVPGGWVRGGDILDGEENGGESIYGKTFDGKYKLPFSL